ncbi:MAG: hypothetical protein GY769_08040 [bacterium]|nr:hypothetical protein [bacterium]
MDKVRTARARLNCRFCRTATVHDYSHEQVLHERVRRSCGWELETSVDLWYKCRACGGQRRWGHELAERQRKAAS